MAAGGKTKAGLMLGVTLLLCLILCGCAQAPLLSQREIVHGLFFQRQGKETLALLLLADQPKGEGGEAAGYKTVVGVGQTPSQALERAESSLDGQVFYGLMDLAVLPAEGDWNSITELGRLLYEKTRPSPQFTLFLMESLPKKDLEETAPGLYEKMENALAKYGIRNGLQLMFSAQNECALPLWQGTGYGFVFLQKGRPNTILKDALPAQLGAILCGQADRLECDFSQGTAAIQAKAMVQHRVQENGSATLYLTLDKPELQELSVNHRQEKQLQQTLCEELEYSFHQIISGCCVQGFDPLRMRVWFWAAYGPMDSLPQPGLEVSFET